MVVNSATCTNRAKRFSRVEHVERVDDMMKNNREVCVYLPRGGNATVGCMSMRTGSMGGGTHCDNLLWQSCRTFILRP